MAIGRALAELDDGDSLTASQLQDAIGKHQSNLKKSAEELVHAQVLKVVEPPPANGQPGRRARTAFAFAADQRERFEELLDEEPPPQFSDAGTHLVFVDARDAREALWKLLSQAGVTNGLDRAWYLEGQHSEMMFAFKGPTAVDDSLDFLEILTAAEVDARRQSISKSTGSRELRKAARRRRDRVERSRERLGSMQTAPRPEP